jgi:hypothetical protein
VEPTINEWTEEAAMHAVIVNLNIADGQFDASRKVLHDNLVPQISRTPGFVRGYWTAAQDRRSGTTIVIFKTQSDAENAATNVRGRPTSMLGVTVGSVEVREVVAEA